MCVYVCMHVCDLKLNCVCIHVTVYVELRGQLSYAITMGSGNRTQDD